MVGTFQPASLICGGSHNALAMILSLLFPSWPLREGSTITVMRPPMRKPALKWKYKIARQSAQAFLSIMSNSNIYNGNEKMLVQCFDMWAGVLQPSTYFLDIVTVVHEWIMDKGSRAAVDNFLEVMYRRKSKVRLLLLTCGWRYGYRGHSRSHLREQWQAPASHGSSNIAQYVSGG